LTRTHPAWLDDCLNLQRSLVSEGFDATLAAVELQAGEGFTRHAFSCGSEVFTWVVPPRWVAREARITAGGVTLVDAAQHPLHLMTHSAPFSGRVSRDELLKHLHTDPARPDVLPCAYRFYSRAWGFCVPHSWLGRFTADHYDVIEEILGVIDRDVTPRPLYRSIPFLTRFGLWQDWFGDAELRRCLERLLRLLDGSHSVFDLVHLSGLPVDLAEDLLRKMTAAGLVSLDGDPVPIAGSPRASAPA
jgi:aminopeptidase-like protein